MGFTLFISLFFLVGFVLLGVGLRSVYKAKLAEGWSETKGAIQSCELVEDSSGDGTTWQVKVSYDYSVAGRRLSGDRVAFGYGGSSARQTHEALHEKLSQAAVVRVRYNPLKPEDAVLAAGVNRSNFVILIFAVVWLFFTTGFTVLWNLGSGKDSKLTDSVQVIEFKGTTNRW
ncbi:MAG TPA: DUF3592 domain-containing protein [Candidatus Paceibacterota bacterium]|nr:DUF3592 domain-containing protein [Candidatus Paceibacterota bacterium]